MRSVRIAQVHGRAWTQPDPHLKEPDISAPPFWELARGGGPVTRAIGTRKRYARLAQIRDQLSRLILDRAGGGLGSKTRREMDEEIADLRAEATRLDPDYRVESWPIPAEGETGIEAEDHNG